MQDSYPFPVYSGVLNPIHYKHIDKAIWLFLWCISATTKDIEKDGVNWGIVLGGKPVQQDELAERFGVSIATVKRWIEKLEEHDYIKTKRAPYGLIFYVKNSKKFSFKNELSHDRGSSSMNYQSSTDSSKVIHLTSKNELSNKDIIKDFVVVDENLIMTIVSKVEQHFIQKRAKGHFISPTDFAEIKSTVADGIPLEVICSAIDKSFLEYKPKHQFDEIRTFSYCKPIVYSEWERLKPTSITGAVPHVPVALANGTGTKSRQQQAFDMLDQIAEE